MTQLAQDPSAFPARCKCGCSPLPRTCLSRSPAAADMCPGPQEGSRCTARRALSALGAAGPRRGGQPAGGSGPSRSPQPQGGHCQQHPERAVGLPGAAQRGAPGAESTARSRDSRTEVTGDTVTPTRTPNGRAAASTGAHSAPLPPAVGALPSPARAGGARRAPAHQSHPASPCPAGPQPRRSRAQPSGAPHPSARLRAAPHWTR